MIRSILLHRIRPAANEARFYFLQIGPTLTDEMAVTRVWGRLGRWQRIQVTPCTSREAAQNLARRLVRRRLQRGYQIIQGGNEWIP